jgi:hypothetical protein
MPPREPTADEIARIRQIARKAAGKQGWIRGRSLFRGWGWTGADERGDEDSLYGRLALVTNSDHLLKARRAFQAEGWDVALEETYVTDVDGTKRSDILVLEDLLYPGDYAMFGEAT